MKKLSVLVLIALVAFTGTAAAEGLILSVRHMSPLQSGQIGYRSGSFAPYFGVDFLSISAEGSAEQVESYSQTIGGTTTQYRFVDEITLDGSARLAIADIGARYYFGGGTGDMQPYGFLSIFKCFPSVSAEGKTQRYEYVDGVEQPRDDPSEFELEGELEDALNDLLGFKGFTLGFGGEYFFADTFSVSGEYGLRWIMFSTEYDETTVDEDSFFDDYREEYKAEADATLRMTYGVVALNYHFGERDG